MREIKFRVRDANTHKVYAYEWLENNQWHFEHDYDDGEDTIIYPLNYIGIREQFTGLKDRNGKEIYEGDTVRLPDDFRYYDCHMNLIKCGEVVFTDRAFEIDCFHSKNTHYDGGWNRLEIIGNI